MYILIQGYSLFNVYFFQKTLFEVDNKLHVSFTRVELKIELIQVIF
jgi:hypothetical protein